LISSFNPNNEEGMPSYCHSRPNRHRNLCRQNRRG
jgi:hypothetical protein